MLALVMCVERDDVVHWALSHKTGCYFTCMTTNWDFLDLKNVIFNPQTYKWFRAQIKNLCLSLLTSLSHFVQSKVTRGPQEGAGHRLSFSAPRGRRQDVFMITIFRCLSIKVPNIKWIMTKSCQFVTVSHVFHYVCCVPASFMLSIHSKKHDYE